MPDETKSLDSARTASNQEDDQDVHRMPKDEEEAMFPTNGSSSRVKSIDYSTIRPLRHRFDGSFLGTNEIKSEP